MANPDSEVVYTSFEIAKNLSEQDSRCCYPHLESQYTFCSTLVVDNHRFGVEVTQCFLQSRGSLILAYGILPSNLCFIKRYFLRGLPFNNAKIKHKDGKREFLIVLDKYRVQSLPTQYGATCNLVALSK